MRPLTSCKRALPRPRPGFVRPVSQVLGTLLLVAAMAMPSAAQSAEESEHFNRRGNILISDQFNNRVIEVDRHHHVVWQFGTGSNVAGPHSIVGVNDAQRVGRFTLMAGTGVPPASPPFEPGCDNGCQDNRVIVADPDGHIVWQYGQAGVPGAGPNQLNTPVQATFLPNFHILITDQANERVIEVNLEHEIVWQYGMTGMTGNGFNQLNNPNSAELLENGHILISDENNNRVIEVTRKKKKIVWQYGSGDPTITTPLNGAAFASRLENGNTLITDSLNNRIVEVSEDKQLVGQYFTANRVGSVAGPFPTRAVRLRNGHTLISDQFNDQVIEVDSLASGNIVFTQGDIGVAGVGFDDLNAPYDAKAIGDYTGLTSPFE
jgi:hypothetical protein